MRSQDHRARVDQGAGAQADEPAARIDDHLANAGHAGIARSHGGPGAGDEDRRVGRADLDQVGRLRFGGDRFKHGGQLRLGQHQAGQPGAVRFGGNCIDQADVVGQGRLGNGGQGNRAGDEQAGAAGGPRTVLIVHEQLP